jgi:hypothetical protein
MVGLTIKNKVYMHTDIQLNSRLTQEPKMRPGWTENRFDRLELVEGLRAAVLAVRRSHQFAGRFIWCVADRTSEHENQKLPDEGSNHETQ